MNARAKKRMRGSVFAAILIIAFLFCLQTPQPAKADDGEYKPRLHVIVTAAVLTYGDILPSKFELTYSGFVGADSKYTPGVLEGEAVFSCDAGLPGSVPDAGSYPIFASGLTSQKYELYFNAGMLTVKKAARAAPNADIIQIEETAARSVTLKAVEGLEYSVDGGITWQGAPTFKNLAPNTEYTVHVRYAENKNFFASPASAEGVALRTQKAGNTQLVLAITLPILGGAVLFVTGWLLWSKKKNKKN